MPLQNTSERKTYIQILNGRFSLKSNKDNVEAVERINKKGDTVYELLYDKLSEVKIKSMSIEKTDYGKNLEIFLTDKAENFILSIPVESKYFDSFCAKIGNADLSKDMTLAPYSFQPKEGGNKRTGMSIYQHGNKLEYYFTPDNLHGKPTPKAEHLDDDDWKIFKMQERKFYCEYINTLGFIKPESVPTGGSTSDILTNDESSDDLPF